MTIDLTPVLNAIIAILAALIVSKVVPWLNAKTTNEQRQGLAAALRTAVFAAEQVFGAGHGAEKMDYALKYLREKGFTVDSRDVEAAVAQYLNLEAIIEKLLPSKTPDDSAGGGE